MYLLSRDPPPPYYLEEFLEGFVGLIFPVQSLFFRDLLLGPKVDSRVHLGRRYPKYRSTATGRWNGGR